MNENIKEKRIRRKYSSSGIKATFLAKKQDGSFMDGNDTLEAVATLIRDAGLESDLANVYYKSRTREFFIVTNTSMYGLEDVSEEFAKAFKKNWTTTFLNFTIGVYTCYLDQYEDVTALLKGWYANHKLEEVDYWNMKMTKR